MTTWADNLFVAGGHQSLLDHIASSVLSSVHLQMKVTAIHSIMDGNSDPKVIVTVGDNNLHFDEVVVTVPVGCLKRHALEFDPPLPPRICLAIANASYSSLEKIYLAFPTAFWDQASTSEELQSLTLAQFLRPKRTHTREVANEVQVLPLSSCNLFGDQARPALMLYTYGPFAEHILSRIRHLSRSSQEYLWEIDRLTQPFYKHLPNFVSGSQNCTPVAALATNWHDDELAGNGSYSNFQVMENSDNKMCDVRLDEDVRAMREGMPDRGIWLAGEHTAPFVALGTSTGAYWSGEAVGMRILAANRMVNEERMPE